MSPLHFKQYGEGKGPPLVILHGLFGSLENWHHIATRLSDEFEVFSLDLRNHGRSPHHATMDYPSMAQDVFDFIKYRNLNEPALLGHSMGGKTAMQFALSYPGQLSALIVVDIAPKAYPPWHATILEAMLNLRPSDYTNRWEMDEALEAAIPESAVRQFLLKSVSRGEKGQFHWRLNLNAISSSYETLMATIPARGPVDTPSLFVAGEFSDYLSPQDHPAIRDLFPNAEFAVLPGAGHWLHAEAPDQFLGVVSPFLRAHAFGSNAHTTL